MQDRRSNRAGSLCITLALWFSGVALLFLIKAVIEWVHGPIAETWVDLTLVLSAYLFFFLLKPLQNWRTNRSRRHARRKSRLRQTS